MNSALQGIFHDGRAEVYSLAGASLQYIELDPHGKTPVNQINGAMEERLSRWRLPAPISKRTSPITAKDYYPALQSRMCLWLCPWQLSASPPMMPATLRTFYEEEA